MLWPDKSTFQLMDNMSSELKKKRTIHIVTSAKVQKSASVVLWGCVSTHGMGNLHICEGSINAGRYIHFFGATYPAI